MQEMLIARWTDARDKLIALAEAFPGERYDFRPVDAVRTFAEQLRHVAYWNIYAAGLLRGESPDDTGNEISPERYADKASIIAGLAESFDAVGAGLRGAGEPSVATTETALTYVQHVAEHYGQLTLYTRLNAIVPPASRV